MENPDPNPETENTAGYHGNLRDGTMWSIRSREYPYRRFPALFQNYFATQAFIDFRLVCFDGIVGCHKIVLASSSAFFGQYLVQFENNGMLSLSNPFYYSTFIIHQQIGIVVLKLLLEFIYTGEVSIPRHLLPYVITAGAGLQIHEFISGNHFVSIDGTELMHSENNSDESHVVREVPRNSTSNATSTSFLENSQLNASVLVQMTEGETQSQTTTLAKFRPWVWNSRVSGKLNSQSAEVGSGSNIEDKSQDQLNCKTGLVTPSKTGKGKNRRRKHKDNSFADSGGVSKSAKKIARQSKLSSNLNENKLQKWKPKPNPNLVGQMSQMRFKSETGELDTTVQGEHLSQLAFKNKSNLRCMDYQKSDLSLGSVPIDEAGQTHLTSSTICNIPSLRKKKSLSLTPNNKFKPQRVGFKFTHSKFIPIQSLNYNNIPGSQPIETLSSIPGLNPSS